MKNIFKSKKTTVLALSIIGSCGLASAIAASLVANTNQQTSSRVDNNAIVNNAKITSINNGVSDSIYKKLTFVSNQEVPMEYVGSTVIRVLRGHLFGTIIPPQVISTGYHVSAWKWVEMDRTIDANLVIDQDMTLMPILSPNDVDFSISGDKTIYFGLRGYAPESEGAIDFIKENGWEYSLWSSDPLTDDTTIQWKIEYDETQGPLPVRYVESDDKTKLYVLPSNVTQSKDTQIIRIIATVTAGQESKQVPLSVTIDPPHFCDSEQTFIVPATSETVDIDFGKVFWCLNTSSNQWTFSLPDWICVNGDDTEDEFVSFAAIQNKSTYNFEKFERSDATGWKAERTVWYPGAEINKIDDGFLAFIKGYNPKIEKGRKEIVEIGDNFLFGDTDFNNSLSQILNPSIPMEIGDNFLAGCTSFNGGYEVGEEEPFVCPNAWSIGQTFMWQTAIKGDFVLNSNLRIVGSFFLNECSALTRVVIPQECNAALTKIGESFLYDCEKLSALEIGTQNLFYFKLTDKSTLAINKETDPSAAINVIISGDTLQQYFRNMFPNFRDGNVVRKIEVISPAP